jgi:hypothetical protein
MRSLFFYTIVLVALAPSPVSSDSFILLIDWCIGLA